MGTTVICFPQGKALGDYLVVGVHSDGKSQCVCLSMYNVWVGLCVCVCVHTPTRHHNFCGASNLSLAQEDS